MYPLCWISEFLLLLTLSLKFRGPDRENTVYFAAGAQTLGSIIQVDNWCVLFYTADSDASLNLAAQLPIKYDICCHPKVENSPELLV